MQSESEMYKSATGEPCQAKPGSPVKLGKVPTWLGKRLLRVFGPTDCGYRDSRALFEYWARKRCKRDWLDHWGTTRIGDWEILVSEPYLRPTDDLSEVAAFAEALGCDLVVGGASHWNPGKTLRLALMP
jgi:hypothetical protein